MKFVLKLLSVILIYFINTYSISYADNHNIYEIIDQLQKDIKTLEKAVYSGSLETNNNANNLNTNLQIKLKSKTSNNTSINNHLNNHGRLNLNGILNFSGNVEITYKEYKIYKLFF